MNEPTDQQKVRKKLGRFSLQAALVLITLVSLLMVVVMVTYTNRYRDMRNALLLLEKNEIYFGIANAGDIPWYDRLPGLSPPPRIEEMIIYSSGKDLEAIVPLLVRLGTIKHIRVDNVTLEEMETLSQMNTIESISTESSLNAAMFRPFTSHKLKNVMFYGTSNNIPLDTLELLLSLPSIERIGTSNGSWDVPDSLKGRRPDVVIFQTDIPA